MIRVFTIISLLLLPYAVSANCHSQQSGNWGSNSTWLCGGVQSPPSCTSDSVFIEAGHTVNIASQTDMSACSEGLTLVIRGTLDFSGGQKLHLPCGSVIIIEPGGTVSASGAGGGNSNLISICDEVVWSKSDGDLTEPQTLTDPTLPVEMTNFEVDINTDKKVELTWTTATEINCDYFLIERSTDGVNYQYVGRVQGNGTSNEIQNYRITDPDPEKGVNYYRLKQVDFDGQYEYFGPLAIDVKAPPSDFKVFPNPYTSSSSGGLKIAGLPNEEDILVVVMDITGKELYSKVETSSQYGETVIGDDVLGKLPPGTYMIIGSSSNAIHKKKLLVQ